MYEYQYGYFILMLPALILSIWAQIKLSSTFSRYGSEPTVSGLTGAEAAKRILERNGVYGVSIERVAGNLTDYFDPRTNVIHLSECVYDRATIGAVGVAAHETGHALQYAEEYGPMRLRSAIIPVTRIGSALSVPLIILGFVMSFSFLVTLGILLYATVAVFQLVTVPVEYNASRRAMQALPEIGMNDETEQKGTKKVLSAAALTYVAALFTSLMSLLRFVLLARSNRR